MTRRRVAPSLVALGLVACGSPSPAPPPPAARPLPAPPEARPDGRLPELAVPLSYELELEVDPARPTFRGTERVVLDLPAATAHVVLHARGPRVTGGALLADGARTPVATAARRAAGGLVDEELVVSFGRVVPAGRATLELAFDAPFGDELTGLYRVEREGARYAFTQFEASEARRAFPCFDEPRWKTPFAVGLTVPAGAAAFANAAEARREALPDGRVHVAFAPTHALPTYLVAFAVGDLETREDPAPPGGTPIRLVTTRGRARLGELALRHTRGLLETLERYLGVRYPYGKLDVVAVPELRAGAMENPGLVTFREERLLLDPTRASARARLEQELVIAHELAHQWFGNLVTPVWWDELWLSEGFASFLETKAVDLYAPGFGARGDALRQALHVADLDASGAARAVRQPVASTSAAREAFDAITYAKGAAVLTQLESWTGAATFQRALGAYLTENAHRAVGSAAFFAALDAATAAPTSARLARYLDAPGIPVVHLEPQCEARGRWSAVVTPEAFRPLGVAMPDAPSDPWYVGVCLSTAGRAAGCVDVEAGAPTMAAGTGGCPAWLLPDAGPRYYRFSLPKPAALALARAGKSLSPTQRLTALANAWASVRAGYLTADALPEIVEALDGESDPHVLRELVRVLGEVDVALVDDGSRARFRAWVGRRLARAKLPARADDEAEVARALARVDLLAAGVDLAGDPKAETEAASLAAAWLAGGASSDPDVGPAAVALAGRAGDAARLAPLAAELARPPADATPERREVLLVALGGFSGEAQSAALDVVLDPAAVKPHEIRVVLGSAVASPRTRPGARAWMERRWEALRARLPGSFSGQLVRWLGGCGAEDAARIEARFGPDARAIEGAPRRLAEVVEATRQCGALRDAAAADFRAALARTKR